MRNSSGQKRRAWSEERGDDCRDELREVMQLVKPQHFLPVHGEYAFLCAHAQLAQETGVNRTSVIRNGQMLGVSELRNSNSVGSAQGMQVIGEASLKLLYNDGNKVCCRFCNGRCAPRRKCLLCRST